MKVAITGATGFIGGNLCKYLGDKGHTVVALARSPDKAKYLESIGVEIRTADITDTDTLEESFAGVDVVINLAALFNHPDLTWEDYKKVNVQGVKNVLASAKKSSVKRVLHCSTVGVATGGPPPYSEKSPYSPPAWDKYETTKCEGEKAALEFHKEHGFPVVVIRPAQVYGLGDISKIKFYKMVKKGVIVNPGATLKHLIYIDDLCRAFELAMVSEKAVGSSVIIAGKEAITLNNLVQIVAGELGVPNPKIMLPALPMTLAASLVEKIFQALNKKPPIFRRSMDFFTKSVEFKTDEAKNLLGFESAIDVKTGVQRTAQWYCDKCYI